MGRVRRERPGHRPPQVLLSTEPEGLERQLGYAWFYFAFHDHTHQPTVPSLQFFGCRGLYRAVVLWQAPGPHKRGSSCGRTPSAGWRMNVNGLISKDIIFPKK